MIKVFIPDDTPPGNYDIVPVPTASTKKPLGPGDLVVDLSRHNQVPDLFPKLKATGVRGVILRATMGNIGIDEKFFEYWELAEKQQFDYLGVYHLFVKETSGQSQAAHFLKTMGSRAVTYPHTIDFEPRSGEVIKSAAEVRASFQPLLDSIQQVVGYPPIVYSAGWAINAFKFEQETWLSHYPLHTAHYTTALKPFVPEPWHSNGNLWFAWQFDEGRQKWSSQFDLKGLEDVALDKNRYSGLPFTPAG